MATHINEKRRIYYVYFERIKKNIVLYTHLLKETSGKCAKSKEWLLHANLK